MREDEVKYKTPKIISISLKNRHRAFFDRNRLGRSMIIQKLLDRLIEEGKIDLK